MFIGLNPSTADEIEDDPTIRRCVGFAKSWGYGGLVMGNLFAFRATEPKNVMNVTDPVGVENDKWLVKLTKEVSLVVGAWGNGGSYKNRGQAVIELIPNMHCLKVNKSGQPAHPLYLKSDLKPKPYERLIHRCT